jgi:nitrogen regulatory protein PII
MKLITAIIKPDKVEALRQALTAVDIQGLTIVEAKGYGRQKGHTELYRGAEYEVHFLPKSRAEVLVDSTDVEKVITTISEAVKSGKIGDGKIYVTDVIDVVRIRTGERGAEAIK